MIFDVARLAFDGFFKAFRRLDVLTQPEEGEAAGDVFFRLRLFPAVDVFDDGLVDGSVGNMLRDIVVDDLSLPFGTLRMKPSGSDGGHNGLKHIAAVLGTQAYARLRFGIGNDFPRGGQVDYVLGQFTEENLQTMEERLTVADEMIKSFCLSGIQFTMNHFNKK